MNIRRHLHQRHSSFATPTRRQLLQASGAALVAGSIPTIATHTVAQDEQVQLDFWNWWIGEREPIMDGIISEFQQEFPTITVNNVTQTWDRRDEIVITALAGGDPPETIMVSRQEIVNFADGGAITPITKYIEEYGVNLDDYYESEISSMWWNGELYALPMPTAGAETGLYFYNTALFEEAGLDAESPPETWEELDEATAKLTKLSSNGAIEQMGANLEVNHITFLSQLYCNNGALYSDDMRTVTFNNEQGVETLQWLLDFVKRHYGSQQNVLDWHATISEGEIPFLQQRLAIDFANVSRFFHLSSMAPDVNYSVHFRPYNSNNPDAKSQGIAGLSFGWGYVIPTGLDPAVEDAAFKFIKRITYDEQGACHFMIEQQRPSPLVSCNERPEFSENNPHWNKVQQVLENDVAIGVVPVQTQLLATLEDYVELVAFEEMSPEEGLNIAAEEAQGILDDYWSSAS